MASSSHFIFLGFALLFVVLLSASPAAEAQGLSRNFYSKSCPRLKSIVRVEMRRALRANPRTGASILRMFFHDCFIIGCDASILLDGDSGEQAARANQLLPGFDVIDAIKSRVEAACSGVVSCADVLALATLEGVKQLGGPSYSLGLGRRDSLTSSLSAANSGQLPPPTSDLDNLITRFNDKGLSATDMTALSGAHTIGQARCTSFRTRLSTDTNIDPQFAANLQKNCPASGGNDNSLASLDNTPTRFDNRYYKNLLVQRGLLHSDQVLFNNGTTDSLVRRYATNQRAFFKDFAAAMTRMSNINPLTGSNGEIRKSCGVVN